MTDAQKHIITELLKGCAIYGHQRGFHLRDTQRNVFVGKINPRTYRQVKYYLRRDKKTGLFVIDKRKVRKEHGNTWIKQEYKTLNQK
jgi:hypothetical protein